ncbi:hypothetical protein Sxan_39320 [Streptomyces xanthophaeus]|uniref:Uncharacterized protein n=1 Tax=Streptomyces xanthophaeus TaxID=67385 RepID=A0A919LAN8_9ACTN|nr:hypothetical protein Sxan_39320 [Streptomyces xanthophaeus]
MPGREGGEVDDEGVDGVGTDQQDQAAFPAEAAGRPVHAYGQLGIAERAVGRDDGGPVAVGGEAEGERDGRGAWE